MTERTGVCSQCDAKYKIPPTFKGTKGKCKKCGGTVVIPPIEAPEPEEAPEKAPAAAPAAGKKAAAGKAVAAGAVRARRGGAARKRGAATRRRSSRRSGGDDEDGNNQMWIWITVGVAAVALIIVLFFVMGGDDDEKVKEPEKTATQPDEDELDTTSETDTADTTEVSDDSEKVEETGTTEVEPVKPEEPEVIDPIINLDPLPPIIGCDQETFDRLTECFTDGFVMEELPKFRRRPLLKEFNEADWRLKVPILLNSFNGLDLLKRSDVALAFRIAEIWNKEVSGGHVDTPVKGDTRENDMQDNLKWNKTAITSVHKIWLRKVEDEDAQKLFFSKCEVRKQKKAEKEARDD